MPTQTRDFFISFTGADRDWAAWIAWTTEEAGYSVWFQDWDFRGNFVLEMDRAHTRSRRTIAVLSPAYFESRFAAPEWAARFAEDGTSANDLLVPVRVVEFRPTGLLAQIVYVDFVGIEEDAAKARLLQRLSGIRRKPTEPPVFPGQPVHREVSERPVFPGKRATHNLPPRNPDFVGRETTLDVIQAALALPNGQPLVVTQAITGLGGVGKTQTALAFAHRQLTNCGLVWWLNAETPAKLAADYAGMAGASRSTSATSPSPRRCSDPSTPTSPLGSTTSPTSTQLPAVSPRPSRSVCAPSPSSKRPCRPIIRIRHCFATTMPTCSTTSVSMTRPGRCGREPRRCATPGRRPGAERLAAKTPSRPAADRPLCPARSDKGKRLSDPWANPAARWEGAWTASRALMVAASARPRGAAWGAHGAVQGSGCCIGCNIPARVVASAATCTAPALHRAHHKRS